MTERQKKILYKVIQEYIESAVPVSSKQLTLSNHFSSATIRTELICLEELGFLKQAHISSGRTPTDKAYRHFANKALSIIETNEISNSRLKDKFQKDIENVLDKHNFFKQMKDTAKQISHNSKNLSIIYFENEDLILYEGWDRVLLEPEFQDSEYVKQFIKMISKLEKNFPKIIKNNPDDVLIYIGNEIGFPEAKDFSLMLSKCEVKNRIAYLALIGPKRMTYKRNIDLIKKANKYLKGI